MDATTTRQLDFNIQTTHTITFKPTTINAPFSLQGPHHTTTATDSFDIANHNNSKDGIEELTSKVNTRSSANTTSTTDRSDHADVRSQNIDSECTTSTTTATTASAVSQATACTTMSSTIGNKNDSNAITPIAASGHGTCLVPVYSCTPEMAAIMIELGAIVSNGYLDALKHEEVLADFIMHHYRTTQLLLEYINEGVSTAAVMDTVSQLVLDMIHNYKACLLLQESTLNQLLTDMIPPNGKKLFLSSLQLTVSKICIAVEKLYKINVGIRIHEDSHKLAISLSKRGVCKEELNKCVFFAIDHDILLHPETYFQYENTTFALPFLIGCSIDDELCAKTQCFFGGIIPMSHITSISWPQDATRPAPNGEIPSIEPRSSLIGPWYKQIQNKYEASSVSYVKPELDGFIFSVNRAYILHFLPFEISPSFDVVVRVAVTSLPFMLVFSSTTDIDCSDSTTVVIGMENGSLYLQKLQSELLPFFELDSPTLICNSPECSMDGSFVDISIKCNESDSIISLFGTNCKDQSCHGATAPYRHSKFAVAAMNGGVDISVGIQMNTHNIAEIPGIVDKEELNEHKTVDTGAIKTAASNEVAGLIKVSNPILQATCVKIEQSTAKGRKSSNCHDDQLFKSHQPALTADLLIFMEGDAATEVAFYEQSVPDTDLKKKEAETSIPIMIQLNADSKMLKTSLIASESRDLIKNCGDDDNDINFESQSRDNRRNIGNKTTSIQWQTRIGPTDDWINIDGADNESLSAAFDTFKARGSESKAGLITICGDYFSYDFDSMTLGSLSQKALFNKVNLQGIDLQTLRVIASSHGPAHRTDTLDDPDASSFASANIKQLNASASPRIVKSDSELNAFHFESSARGETDPNPPPLVDLETDSIIWERFSVKEDCWKNIDAGQAMHIEEFFRLNVMDVAHGEKRSYNFKSMKYMNSSSGTQYKLRRLQTFCIDGNERWYTRDLGVFRAMSSEFSDAIEGAFRNYHIGASEEMVQITYPKELTTVDFDKMTLVCSNGMKKALIRASGCDILPAYDLVHMSQYLPGSVSLPRWYHIVKQGFPSAFLLKYSREIEEAYQMWIRNELLNSVVYLPSPQKPACKIDFRDQCCRLYAKDMTPKSPMKVLRQPPMQAPSYTNFISMHDARNFMLANTRTSASVPISWVWRLNDNRCVFFSKEESVHLEKAFNSDDDIVKEFQMTTSFGVVTIAANKKWIVSDPPIKLYRLQIASPDMDPPPSSAL